MQQPFVYLYDRDHYFYLGVEIADQCQLTGVPILPGFATFKAPPSLETRDSHISVFDPTAQEWRLAPNDFWRPDVTRRLVNLKNTLGGDFSIMQVECHRWTSKYNGIPRVISPGVISMNLTGRLTIYL
ncbi:hypothetical protein [Pseudorhodoferax sp. Leaf274]|uniref:hypothetical protein n=1 Tax=Pseudorhodoferax sp. Leaf274 TaxID=1736318 RepID=UPI0012E2FA2A|nr:hypothetical protein [Pseudorhodoferax sp. Leaf274]